MHLREKLISIPALCLLLHCSGQPAVNPTPAPPASAAVGKAPANAAASPIDGALPSVAPPPFVDRSDCALGATCTLSHLVPDEMVRSLPRRGALVMWEETIAGDALMVFPPDKGVELVGVVLDGGIDVLPLEKEMVDRPLGQRWMGFRAPGGGVSLTPLKGKRARIALALVVVPPETSLAKHVEQWDKDKAPFTWTERQKRIDGIDFDTQDDLAWGNGAYHARIGFGASKYQYGAANGKGPKLWEVDDQPAMVVNLLRFSKDAPLADHVNEKERECLAILEGAGELVLKDKGVPIDPGTTACIPAGMSHGWRPDGTTPFFAIQVYSPPGPEQRFKSLAGKAP